MALDIREASDLREDPEGSRVWVVGGIKGNMQRLEEAILSIEENLTFAKNDKIVFMSDVLGADLTLKDTLLALVEYQTKREDQVVILRGPNEHGFIKTRATFFKSKYGKALVKQFTNKKDVIQIKKLKLIRDWFITFPSIYETNQFVFLHGTPMSNQPLDKQSPEAVMYLKDNEFLEDKVIFPKTVVHSFKNTVVKDKRIGIERGLIVLNDTTAKIEYINP